MNKSESKYYNTALLMNSALIALLDKKDYDFITVTDICEKAGVNRSTFYLHYETKEDLLRETLENIDKEFYNSFGKNDIMNRVATCDVEELNFITPQYLEPYLLYILNHRDIYKAKINHPEVMNSFSRLDSFKKEIFNPIINRFNVNDQDKKYILSFTLAGLNGVIKEWIKNDCKDPIEEIIEFIIRYMPKK